MTNMMLCLVGMVICIVVDLASSAAVTRTPFACRYYSDGTYSCRVSDVSRHDTEDETKQVKGTWKTSDGFFQLTNPKGPKEYVGQCSFSVDGTFECSGAPRTTVHADGSMSAVGGGMFRGLHYTGTPGGSIKTSQTR